MKIKYNYNCEICENKKLCKYYEKSNKYSNKEQIVKLKPKDEADKENLYVSVSCKHYNSIPINTISTYNSTGISSSTENADVHQLKDVKDVFGAIGLNSDNGHIDSITNKLQY